MQWPSAFLHCNWKRGECLALEGFGMSQTQESTWETSKGKGVSGCVVWKRRENGWRTWNGVKQMWGAKEIEVPTLTRRYFPRKGTE